MMMHFQTKEKMPQYYVFREYEKPRVYPWKEFDKISVDCRFTEDYLEQVLTLNLGRVFVPQSYGGIETTKADLEQIKAIYGASDNPENLVYIFVNPTDKKSVARAIYDDFRLDMGRRLWNNQAEKELALEHGKNWIDGIVNQPDEMNGIVIVRQQLRLCLETITSANESRHKPFFHMNYEPFDDNEIGMQDADCNGYPAHPFYRLSDDDFNAMMKAFNKRMDISSENKKASRLATTENLKSIFQNNEGCLTKFLERIQGKKGSKIVDEVVALIKMNVIDKDEAGEPLRKELEELGYDTTTKQNWASQLQKKGRTENSIREIQKKYH